jgi:hypothetical protein
VLLPQSPNMWQCLWNWAMEAMRQATKKL